MKLLLSAMALAVPLLAQAPEGFAHYKSADLKAYSKKLAPKIDAQKVATADLARWGGHWLMVAHREGNGEAELHDTEIDIFLPQTGEATLVVGGEIEGARTTAPGQVRGKSIRNGHKVRLAAGDVVHIPARTPHQVLLDRGEFTYAVVKIESK